MAKIFLSLFLATSASALDSGPNRAFWSGNRWVFVSNFEMRFFVVPKDVEVLGQDEGKWQPAQTFFQGRSFQPRFIRDGKRIALEPSKVLRFSHVIAGPKWVQATTTTLSAIPISPYTLYSPASEEQLMPPRENTTFPVAPCIKEKRCDYDQFHGVISLDGQILETIAWKNTFENILNSVYISPEGKCIFAVDEMRWGNNDFAVRKRTRELIVWDQAEGKKHIAAQEAAHLFPWLNGFLRMDRK